MGMIKEFKEFAIKGNVIDLAVGIIIGAAFGGVVTSLVNDVIMPPIGWVVGNIDFSSLAIVIREGKEATADTPAVPEVAIRYGKFLNTVINFLIVAFAVFLLVKQVNRLRKHEAAAPSDPTTKLCPHCQTTIPILATRCPNCTSELK
jgi:large conductance mechanosensitive channel